MKPSTNHFISGFVLGILAPVAAFWIFVRITDPGESFIEVAQMYSRRNVLTHIISLASLANLAVFFLFLHFQYERAARGVLGATFVYVLIVLALKFF